MSWEVSLMQGSHMDHTALQLLLLSPSQCTVVGIRGRSVQWAFGFSSSFWSPRAMNCLVLPQLLPCSIDSGWDGSGSARFKWLRWDLVTFWSNLNASKDYEFGLVTSVRTISFVQLLLAKLQTEFSYFRWALSLKEEKGKADWCFPMSDKATDLSILADF